METQLPTSKSPQPRGLQNLEDWPRLGLVLAVLRKSLEAGAPFPALAPIGSVLEVLGTVLAVLRKSLEGGAQFPALARHICYVLEVLGTVLAFFCKTFEDGASFPARAPQIGSALEVLGKQCDD